MTPLHLIRVPLATDGLARWAKERGWVKGAGATVFDEGKALHHLVHEVLGPKAFRSFRLLVPPRRVKGNLYAYSLSDADALRAIAAIYACPDHLEVLLPDRLESKPLPDSWHRGQRLGFDVRIRPVRRLLRNLETRNGVIGKGKEVDAYWLEALRKFPSDTNGMSSHNRTREIVYLEWLAERLSPVAELDHSASRLVRFRRTRVARFKNRGPEGPDATIHGTLTVVNPESFATLLARGIGRHRSYGYGMLLLRPPTANRGNTQC